MPRSRLVFQGRDGRLRLLDNSNPPNYIELPFVQMNLNIGGIARPRPEDPIRPTIGGYFHATDEQHEASYAAPVPVSFSCWIDDTTNSWKLRPALCNPDLLPTWTVGTTVWTSTKGGGTAVMSDGSTVQTPTFYDPNKNSVTMECLWSNTGPSAGSAIGVRVEEIYFPPENQAVQESSDFVELTLKGLAYGAINMMSVFTETAAVES